MKVFLDTNVWLSATIFSGLCEELVLQCAQRDWLLSSTLIQTEAHEVLVRKFPQKPDACALFDASWQAAVLIEDVAEAGTVESHPRMEGFSLNAIFSPKK